MMPIGDDRVIVDRHPRLAVAVADDDDAVAITPSVAVMALGAKRIALYDP